VIALPDAVYTVSEANPKLLKYIVKVNDEHYWQFHRENGFSKLGILDRTRGLNTSITKQAEGIVEAASIINKAYIKHNFENLTVVSGINMFPFTPNAVFYSNKL
jgi:hypothetical protein